MTNAGDASKRARRDHAREVARQERDRERKRRARNKLFVQGGVGVAILAILAIVAVVIVGANQPAGPGPRNMASDGILFTGQDGTATPVSTPGIEPDSPPLATEPDDVDGPVHIVEYVDWACPVCQTFEATYADQVQSLVSEGTATLEIHPLAILDNNYAGSRYSSRAANVAACVADVEPESFLAAQETFYTNQPQEGTAGLTDAEMKGLLSDAGIDNPDVERCIDDETFKGWVTAATDRTTSDPDLANANGQFGTPTVFVNGERWDPQVIEFPALLQQAAADAGVEGAEPAPTATPSSTSSATPTPSVTPAE